MGLFGRRKTIRVESDVLVVGGGMALEVEEINE